MFPWHKEGVDGGEGQEIRCVRGGGWWKPCMCESGEERLPDPGSIGKCVLCWPSDQFMKHRKTKPRNLFSIEQEISCVPPPAPPSKLSISINIPSLRENKHCNLICVPSKSNVSFRLLKCKRWACFSHSLIYSVHKSLWRTY